MADIMGKMIKTVIVLCIMVTCVLPSDASDYRREWQAVENFIVQDLPESAYDKVQEIYWKAAKKGDEYQMLRSCVYMGQLGSEFREDYYKEVIDCLNGIMPKLSGIYEPLGWAILGNCYRSYYNRAKYGIRGMERLETPSQDIDLWDGQTWLDTIYSCLYKSVTISTDLTAKTSPDNLEGLVNPGNNSGNKLCPTLLNVLLRNALEESQLRNDMSEGEAEIYKDARFYGTAEDFLQMADEYAGAGSIPWNIDLLARLIRLSADSSDYDLRAWADAGRFFEVADRMPGILGRDPEILKLCSEGLLRLGESYLDKTAESAKLIAAYADLIYYSGGDEREWHFPELVALCEKAAGRWPDSEGAASCRSMILTIQEPSLTMQMSELMSPEGSLIGVLCRNVSQIWFKCVREDDMPELRYNEVNRYKNLRSVVEWKVDVENADDYRMRHLMVQVPSLPAGKYRIIASSDNRFDRKTTVIHSYEVELHSFTYSACLPSNNTGSVCGFVVNRITGRPVEGAGYSIWNVEGRSYERKRTVCVMQGTTLKDGAVSLNVPLAAGSSRNMQVEVIVDGDTLVSDLFLHSGGDRPDPVIARIYTDRYTYRPGETVSFNCVVYQNNGYSSGRTIADADLHMTLFDANWQAVDTLDITTDRFGTASGEFVIPRGLLAGRYTLQVDGDDISHSSDCVINVEEFRQPVFMVEMGSDGRTYVPGDSALVSGTAVTYTGVPVIGAKVSYTVEYVEPIRYMFARVPDRQILSGETVTGPDGGFSVSFMASTGLASTVGREFLNFRVTAKVTDINGETHTSVAYVTAGPEIPSVTVANSSEYTDAPSFSIMLQNAGGDLLEGKVNVTVERLKPVEKLLLDTWNMSGLHDYTPSDEIRRNFPLYRFEQRNDNARQVEKCVYSTVVSTVAGAPYKLQLPKPLENGTYRVTAVVDGVESSDTVLFSSVLPGSKVMPDDRLLLACPVSRSCKVGDTAEILVGSAFAGTPVYYIIENRFGFVEKGVLYPDGGVTPLKFKLTPEMKGGVSVHLAAMKQLVWSSQSVDIEVPFTDKELDIKLVTFRDMLEPDQTETWSMSIRDSEGNPVEAALTLTMFDSALDVYGRMVWTFSPWNSIYIPRNDIIRNIVRYNWRSQFTPQRDYPVFDGERAEFPRVVAPLSYSSLRLRGMTKSAGLDMREFEGLGISTVDEALQGRIAGLDMVSNSNFGSTMSLRGASTANVNAAPVPESVELNDSFIVSDSKETDAPDNIALRTDQNPTAFFITNLRTDSKGEVSFSFTTPQLLTKWNFQGIAHTADLKSAVFMEQVTTRKQLMLQPRAPRFVRQGDELVLSARLSNVSDADIAAKVRLELFDAESGKALDIVSGASSCDVNVPSGGSVGASFKLSIPDDITAITYRMTAASDTHTDGQQEMIPVLSSRTVVTESVSLFNNGNETRDFELKAVSENLLSESAKDRTLTLEYTPSPVWYAIQALPYLEQTGNPSNECLFHRYFANALSSHIIATRPAVGRMLGKWAEIPTDGWQTRLEQNEDLKQTLLQETPWVLDSKDEKENLHRLAEAFAQDRLEKEQDNALKELLQRQEPDGGWSWISGYLPNRWVTGTIVGGIAQMVNLGCLNLDENTELRDAVTKALHWMDAAVKELYSEVERKNVKSVGSDELDWLLAHVYLKEIGVAQDVQELYDFLLKVALKEDSHGMSLHKRASMALLMSATGNSKRAGQLVSTLVERSLYDEEQGRWWRDNTGGFLWHEAPIETQSRIIRALLATGRETEAAECGRWLLKQRQTTHWATSPATAQAVIALLEIGDNEGRSLDVPAVSYITIGGETIQAGGEDTDAGYTIRKWQEPSDPSMGRVSVRNDSPEIGWGALSIQYTEEMDKVRYSGNGISLKRILYRVDEKNDGATLHEVADGESLHVGDRLRIRIELGCDRNLEYVQLKDMRAASFEPVSTRAGFQYNLQDDLRVYVEPQNASQVFYIDRLDRGRYIVEYDVYAEQAGTFGSGIVSAQCMYAPEFRSTAASRPVTVE